MIQLQLPLLSGTCAESFPLATWLGRWGDEHDAYTRELACGGWCESNERIASVEVGE